MNTIATERLLKGTGNIKEVRCRDGGHFYRHYGVNRKILQMRFGVFLALSTSSVRIHHVMLTERFAAGRRLMGSKENSARGMAMKSSAVIQRKRVEQATTKPSKSTQNSSRESLVCQHTHMVYRIGWPGNLVQCASCGEWIAV
jgi:hypothetical protein